MSNQRPSVRDHFWQPMLPGKSLFITRAFQGSILVPIFLAAIFGLWINHVDHLGFQVSADGVKTLWEYHKLSLTILGLIFPLTALVASHHRSIQAAAQISQQYDQNVLNNHFEHSEKFREAWEDQGLEHFRIPTKSLREIHSTTFPKTLSGDFSISQDFNAEVRKQISNNVALSVKVVSGEDSSELAMAIEEIQRDFRDKFGIKAAHPLKLKDKPFSSIRAFVSVNIKALRDLAEVASFLPRHSMRETCIVCDESLKAVEQRLKFAAEREEQLEMEGKSLGTGMESLEFDPETNISNFELFEPKLTEFIESDEFSLEEKIQWFPWRAAMRKREILYPMLPKKHMNWIEVNASAQKGLDRF